jgi:DNA-binding transcriptional ArsR family regulator
MKAPPSNALDGLLHAIADRTRRRILRELKKKNARIAGFAGKQAGLCAFEIEKRIQLSQPTISHHMRILERAGLVDAKRDGHRRRYRRNEELITEMLGEIKKQL